MILMSSIEVEIEVEAKRRVALIIKNVAAGITTIEAEINKRGGVT